MSLCFRHATKPIPRAIDGWPLYEVTVDGQVISYHGARGQPIRVLRPGRGSHGYLTVALHRDDIQKTFCVHRLVMEAFGSPCPGPDFEVRHYDGDKSNNRATNLVWGTRSDNMRDMLRHGRSGPHNHPERMSRGSAVGTAKLNESQVTAIKRRIAQGHGDTAIARDEGVSRVTIRFIRLGKTWLHVKED